MKRFLKSALAILVLVVFAGAFLLVLPGLQKQAEQTAEADLTVLANAALARMDSAEQLYEDIRSSADGAILCRARAVSRVIAHDDTLLSTEALVALCQQLDLYLIDVTAPDGEIIGSSEAGYVGTSILEDKTLAWTAEVFEDPTKEYTETDPGDDSVRMGCVPRGDAVGTVLVRAKDGGVAAAKVAADPAEVLRQMSFIQDTLELAEGAKAGTTQEDGRLVVRVTKDGTTVAASRPLSSVYTVRNAAMLMLGALMVVCLAAAVVIQLLLARGPKRDKPRRGDRGELPEETALQDETLIPEGEAEQPQPDTDHPEAPAEQPELPEEPEKTEKQKKRREKKPRQKIFEFVEVEEVAEVFDAQEEAPEPEPIDEEPAEQPIAQEPEPAEEPAKVEKARRKKPARKGKASASAPEGENEEGFDKIF